VDLVTYDKLLKGVGHFLIDDGEVDRVGSTKEAASKEGVTIRDLASWETHQWIQPESIVVVDLFGLNPIEYRLFLLSQSKRLAKVSTLFLYHSHLQDQEVAAQLCELENFPEALPLQSWQENPLEILVEPDETAMIARLMDFLKEDSQKPEKQDIVIFMPVDRQVRRFASRMGEELSVHSLKEQVQLITKAH
jgi:hypothetical protein